MAQSYGDVRVLPEWTAAYVGGVVSAALTALVPHCYGGVDLIDGTGAGLAAAFLPGRWRVFCFLLVTAWQIGVIATANYAFLNYLVLILAFLLLNDAALRRFVPSRWKGYYSGFAAGSRRRRK